jgi:stearoyl-CoA desaturase (delta-9 desaturase)
MKSISRMARALVTRFDTHRPAANDPSSESPKWNLPIPFLILNLSVLWVFVVGFSWVALGVAAALYVIRMFGITAGYHRYFSHRTYKANRWMQFVIAVVGNSATQRGPLWWASHHRLHHAHSDTPQDAHSPSQGGFWNSHMLWWGRKRYQAPRLDLVKDLTKYPELVFLDRFDMLVPILLMGFTYALGAGLDHWFPGLGTSGWQMMAWGFVVSTVLLFHGVATINSLSHVFGKRRFKTSDDSRNNFWLALITLGEGWHNNHHHYPNSARQGFYWWEIDLSYYGLKALEKLGLVRDLKPVPARILADGRAAQGVQEGPLLKGAPAYSVAGTGSRGEPAWVSEGSVLGLENAA